MFIPLIIAILMGLVTPTTNNANCNGGGTVYVNSDDPSDPNDPNEPEDPGDGEDDDQDGPGGDNGHIPPPKP